MRLNLRFANILLGALLVLPGSLAAAQNNYLYAVGDTNFNVNIPIENGYVNLANGELHLEIPLATQAQRGNLKLDERLVYDSRIWMIGDYSGYHWWPTNVPNSSDGWRFVSGGEAGSIQANQVGYFTQPCLGGDQIASPTYQYTWTDPSGVVHSFDALWYETVFGPGCEDAPPPSEQTAQSWADDASGYQMVLSGEDNADPNIQILDKDGAQVASQDWGGNPVEPEIVDRFGNYWSSDTNGNLVDDLGRTPVITTTSGNQTYYDVLTEGGGRSRYTVTMETLSVQTAFDESSVVEWSGTLQAIQSIQLPDGSAYSFTYDEYGEMTSMTLPTGGVVNLGWSNFRDAYLHVNRWLTSYSGGHGSLTFAPAGVSECSSPDDTGCQVQVEVTYATGEFTFYLFTMDNGAWETAKTVSQSSSDTLLSETTGYDFSHTCPTGVCTGAEYITKQTDATMLDDTGVSTQTTYVTDPQRGQPDSIKQWDFYTTTPPSNPVIDQEYTYTRYSVPYGDGAVYYGYDLGTVTLFDGNQPANQLSQTSYSYNTTATATSGIVGHGAPPSGQAEPYLASIGQWVNTNGTELATSFTNDDTGAQLTSTSPSGTTSFSRDASDTFVTMATPPTPSSGISLPQSAAYDASTGLATSRTDPNGETTTTSYDWAGRPTQINYPDGGQESFSYTPAQTSDIRSMSATENTDTETLLDSFGRLSRVEVANGQQTNPWNHTDYCYDADGRLGFKSYPYQGPDFSQAPEVCTGAGDAYSYDALGRITQVLHGDGTSISYQYAGQTTTITDENGNRSQQTRDALGRLITVAEPDATGALSLETDYRYDVLNDLTEVDQWGGPSGSSGERQRLFTYDSLGRKLSANNPESGLVQYAYTNGGSPCSGAPANVCVRTDARGVTTTYSYDALNRLTSKTYSDGTPSVAIAYDILNGSAWETYPWGGNVAGQISQILTKAGSGAGSTVVSNRLAVGYDQMGRPEGYSECSGTDALTCDGQPFTEVSYDYDLAGNISDFADEFGLASGKGGDGKDTFYTYDEAGNVSSVVSELFLGNGNDPVSTLLASPTYNARGERTSANLALNAQSQAEFAQARSYSSRGWLMSETDDTADGAVYSYSTTRLGNGNVSSVNDLAMGPWSYGYDPLNRLISATWTGATPNITVTWTYDAFGNRETQTASPSGVIPDESALSYTGYSLVNGQLPGAAPVYNNRVDGENYDASGNLLDDGAQSYLYDGEGRLCAQKSDWGPEMEGYVYDGLGNRISQGTITSFSCDLTANGYAATTVYVNGLDGKLLEEGDGSGDGQASQMDVYTAGLNGQLLATYASAHWAYAFNDWLGTKRVTMLEDGTGEVGFGSLPFGDFLTQGGSGTDASEIHFTGQPLDSITSNDYFGARFYRDSMSRFITPDPSGLAYASPANPQSLNLYSYALNNPLAFIDPSGLSTSQPVPCGTDNQGHTRYCMTTDVGIPCSDPMLCASLAYEQAWWDYLSTQGRGYYVVSSGPLGYAAGANAKSVNDPSNNAWYKDSCITGALAKGAASAGIDAVGLLPEAGGISRMIGHGAGYVGVVADRAGYSVVNAVGKSTSTVHGLAGLSDTSTGGVLSTGLTVAGFIPGLGQASAIGSIIMDTYKTAKAISQCP